MPISPNSVEPGWGRGWNYLSSNSLLPPRKHLARVWHMVCVKHSINIARNHLPVVKRGGKNHPFKKSYFCFILTFTQATSSFFLEFNYTKEFIISNKYLAVHVLTWN